MNYDNLCHWTDRKGWKAELALVQSSRGSRTRDLSTLSLAAPYGHQCRDDRPRILGPLRIEVRESTDRRHAASGRGTGAKARRERVASDRHSTPVEPTANSWTFRVHAGPAEGRGGREAWGKERAVSDKDPSKKWAERRRPQAIRDGKEPSFIVFDSVLWLSWFGSGSSRKCYVHLSYNLTINVFLKLQDCWV